MKYFDNTRIASYRSCPRKYYYRHVRHWVRDGDLPTALVFGLSWHDAMDVVWGLAGEKLTDFELTKAGAQAFHEVWVDSGMASMEDFNANSALYETYGMRNPMTAVEMLSEYVKQRRAFIKSHKVIAIEQPFVVDLPGNNEVKYVGRLDKVIQENNESIRTVEHKTTSAYAKVGNFRKEFIESFSPNSQVDGYTHQGKSQWGSRFKGVLVDASLVHKTVHGAFKFIPIDKQTGAIENFVIEVNDWIRRILMDDIFPKNTDACWDYNSRCGYYDLCKFYNRGEQIQEIPQGFKVDKWEPYEILKLEGIGLPKESE